MKPREELERQSAAESSVASRGRRRSPRGGAGGEARGTASGGQRNRVTDPAAGDKVCEDHPAEQLAGDDDEMDAVQGRISQSELEAEGRRPRAQLGAGGLQLAGLRWQENASGAYSYTNLSFGFSPRWVHCLNQRVDSCLLRESVKGIVSKRDVKSDARKW